MKKKAMSSEKARFVRAQGHADALEFANLIGQSCDYQNDPKAKKDVIDQNGDAHSVKSGTKRWQIFLYGKNRFESDDAFLSMNGIGQLLIKCLDVYPETFMTYQTDKKYYKEQLKIPMIELKDKFQEKRRVRTFLNKAIFNGGEVDYWTIKYEDKFHLFFNKDVIKCFADNFEIVNSQARRSTETSEQKVLFRYKKLNVGELEIRNSGENHYREVLFVMNKIKVVEMLFDNIKLTGDFNSKVLLYGQATKKFKT